MSRLNTEARKRVKAIRQAFTESGFDEDEAGEMARIYYNSMTNKFARARVLKDLKPEESATAE